MSDALLVLGMQNDFFSGGSCPFWNADEMLESVIRTIDAAQQSAIPVVLVRHVSDRDDGAFRPSGNGSEIHERIADAAPGSIIVEAKEDDGFDEPELRKIVDELSVNRLILCGAWLYVTCLALSEHVENKYEILVLEDCSSHISQALDKVSTRTAGLRTNVTTSIVLFPNIGRP